MSSSQEQYLDFVDEEENFHSYVMLTEQARGQEQSRHSSGPSPIPPVKPGQCPPGASSPIAVITSTCCLYLQSGVSADSIDIPQAFARL